MENLQTMYEIDIINIIKFKNNLQFTIINILYNNFDKEFTKESLYYELNNSIFKLQFNNINNEDFYIIFSFVWILLLTKNSNFIINRDNRYIKININYYKLSEPLDKTINETISESLNKTINETISESLNKTSPPISIEYFIKHIEKYKEIYIDTEIIEYFVKSFEFTINDDSNFNNLQNDLFNLLKELLPKPQIKYAKPTQSTFNILLERLPLYNIIKNMTNTYKILSLFIFVLLLIKYFN